MLKGHAKIELTNVKTGEKKVIEHDNMLTNYYRDLFTPRGIAGRNIVHTGIAWDKQQMFGGILLFENPLDNDADNYKFPHSNKMIARGSNIAYSGTDTTMGSFNSAESVFADDSATLVWDWTQERGNGTISALGLTSFEGGLIGAGRDIEGDTTDASILAPNTHRVNETANIGGGTQYPSPVYIDRANNKMYAVIYKNNALTVREYQFVDSGLDLLTILTVNNTNALPQDISKYKETVVNMASYNLGSDPVSFCYDGKLYITAATGAWGSGSKTFVRYDFATGTIDTVSISNNTGESIYMTSFATNRTAVFAIYNGCLYGATTANHVAYINLADNTDCGFVKDGNGETIARSISTNLYSIFAVVWGELFFNASTIWANNKGDANQKKMYVLDSKNVARRRNLAPFWMGAYDLFANLDGYNDSVVAIYANQGSGAPIRAYNLMCLATKNNLDSAVTKTADMTMRVTYTIREVSE